MGDLRNFTNENKDEREQSSRDSANPFAGEESESFDNLHSLLLASADTTIKSSTTSTDTRSSITLEHSADGSLQAIVEPLENGETSRWCLNTGRRELYDTNRNLKNSKKISLALGELFDSKQDFDGKQDLKVVKAMPKPFLVEHLCEAIENDFAYINPKYSDKLNAKQLKELVYDKHLPNPVAISVATLWGLKDAIKSLPNRSDANFDGITRDDIIRLKALAQKDIDNYRTCESRHDKSQAMENPLVTLTGKRFFHFANKQVRYSNKLFPGGPDNPDGPDPESIRVKDTSDGLLPHARLFTAALISYSKSPDGKHKLMNMIKDQGDNNYTVSFLGAGEPIKVGPLAPAEKLLCASSYENGYWLTVFETGYRKYLEKHPNFDPTDENSVMHLISKQKKWYMYEGEK